MPALLVLGGQRMLTLTRGGNDLPGRSLAQPRLTGLISRRGFGDVCRMLPTGYPAGRSPLEGNHEPELGFFPVDGGVRVGIQFPETLLGESFFRNGQRPVIQPLVPAQFHTTSGNRTCPGAADKDRLLP